MLLSASALSNYSSAYIKHTQTGTINLLWIWDALDFPSLSGALLLQSWLLCGQQFCSMVIFTCYFTQLYAYISACKSYTHWPLTGNISSMRASHIQLPQLQIKKKLKCVMTMDNYFNRYVNNQFKPSNFNNQIYQCREKRVKGLQQN